VEIALTMDRQFVTTKWRSHNTAGMH
jgi:hypothetical protein